MISLMCVALSVLYQNDRQDYTNCRADNAALQAEIRGIADRERKRIEQLEAEARERFLANQRLLEDALKSAQTKPTKNKRK